MSAVGPNDSLPDAAAPPRRRCQRADAGGARSVCRLEVFGRKFGLGGPTRKFGHGSVLERDIACSRTRKGLLSLQSQLFVAFIWNGKDRSNDPSSDRIFK